MLPNVVFAAPIIQNLANDSTYVFTPRGQFWQGIGSGLASYIPAQLQIMTGDVNFSPTSRYIAVIQSFSSKEAFEHGFSGQGGGVASSEAVRTSDSSGFVTFTFSTTTPFTPTEYYAVGVFATDVGATYFSSIKGTGSQFNFNQYFYVGTPTFATTTGSVYMQIADSGGVAQYFTPAPGYSGFASSTLSSTCEPPSDILDVGGGVRYGVCTSMSFLFVPSQNSLTAFYGLKDQAASKIPFSYFFSIKNDFDALTASTSVNLPVWSYNFSSVDLGSSTPMGNLFSPNITILSTTTISTYLSDTNRNALLFLERVAIWLGVALYFYRRIIPHKILV